MAEQTAVVTPAVLNLRPEPSTDRPPLARLERGTRIRILGVEGAWYQVRTDLGDGFVHGDFVTVLEEEPAAGFLHERDDLRNVPLEVGEAERIRIEPDHDWSERSVARIWNDKGGLLGLLSELVDVADAASVAVLQVESSGSGFDADGRLKIRFENHVFWSRWGRDHAEIFERHFRFDASRHWQGHRFRARQQNPWEDFHAAGQEGEWRAFEHARELDEPAALSSISMGAAQVMGFNHYLIGYGSPRSMFERLREGERFHILGLFDFIKGPGTTSPMLEALRRRSFTEFATRYNGSGQAAKYGSLIEEYVSTFDQLRAG
jgi:hypothetical protein